ncbi:BrnT family toxin [Thiohalocapsa marina]|uniref:BrnT family toxin n=1 Tax=Thiohalocapsa marina TaxID=424902 RepID=UPI001FE76A77|nr:BrnT family toxin [Thiohalocapsa marina]
MSEANFEWDEAKSLKNREKHGVSFYEAQHAFLDPSRVIAEDLSHSQRRRKGISALAETRRGMES